MMKWWCVLIQRWLPDYPDGELSPFWRRRLEAHLQVCPQCRQELEELQGVAQTYRQLLWPAPEPGFWQDFNRELHLKLARLNHQAPAPERRRSRLRYLWGAPVLAVLLVFLVSHLVNLSRPLDTGRLAEMPKTEEPRTVTAGPQMDLAKERSRAPGSETGRFLEADGEHTLMVHLKTAANNGLAAEQVIYAGLDDGVWLEEFPSWDVDALLADLSQYERKVLAERLSSRR
jgi:hypothetical protein